MDQENNENINIGPGQEPGREALDIGLLDLGEISFYRTEGGFTGLRYKDKDYAHITLRRVAPIAMPLEYISVADHENKEIGIIRSVEGLPAEQRLLVEAELDSRYYSPEAIEIISIKDKLGYVYIEMKLRNKSGRVYEKSCAVKDVSRNIRMLSDNSLIIFDVDGNRYIIAALSKLDKNSLKRLDPYLF